MGKGLWTRISDIGEGEEIYNNNNNNNYTTTKNTYDNVDDNKSNHPHDREPQQQQQEQQQRTTTKGGRRTKCFLSAGEKQLLCICRSLLNPAPVFLCDEITSCMDKETEGMIMDLFLNFDSDENQHILNNNNNNNNNN